MPPRGVKSAKRERQYEHIKASAKERGESTDRAEEIAARTVNKQRRKAGETKGAAKRARTRAATSRSAKTSTAAGARSTSGRTTAPKRTTARKGTRTAAATRPRKATRKASPSRKRTR